MASSSPGGHKNGVGQGGKEIIRTFPVASTAPPIVTTSFTLRNASGSSAAARAQFVSGPMATMVIVSGSFSRKILSISLCAGWDDALKEKVGSVRFPVSFAASVIIESGGGCSNKCFHVSSGERCGCYIITLSGYGRPLYAKHAYCSMDATKSVCAIWKQALVLYSSH
jgi:hypothetical protein